MATDILESAPWSMVSMVNVICQISWLNQRFTILTIENRISVMVKIGIFSGQISKLTIENSDFGRGRNFDHLTCGYF